MSVKNTFDLPIKVLKALGIFIERDSTWYYYAYAIFMQLIFLYIWTVLMGIYTFFVKDLTDFADHMSSFSTYISCCIKTINVFIHINALKELVVLVKKTSMEFGLETKYHKHLRYAELSFKGYWASTFLTVFFAGFVPFFVHRMAYPMYFPYDLEVPLFYWISAFYQWIGTICYSSANVMMDMLPVLFMAYIVAFLEHLNDNLEKLKKHRSINSDGSVNETLFIDNKQKLQIYVKYQIRIIEITRKAQKVFSVMIFVQGLFTALILCTTSFALSRLILPDDQILFIKFSTYMLAMTTQIFIPCFYGSRLSASYNKISDALSHSEWMFEDKDYRQNVKFMMEYAKAPLKISAFGLFEVDLETFMRILNSAYSLYAVFKRVN
jgi:gustatory receptor